MKQKKVEKLPIEEVEIKGPARPNVQAFEVYREFDETGISGVGLVIDGCVHSTGHVSICWVRSAQQSTSQFASFEAFKEIHIDSHPSNHTKVVWVSAIEPSSDEKS